MDRKKESKERRVNDRRVKKGRFKMKAQKYPNFIRKKVSKNLRNVIYVCVQNVQDVCDKEEEVSEG